MSMALGVTGIGPVRTMLRGARGANPALVARLSWILRRSQWRLTARIVDHFARRGDTVVDIGANWGVFAWRLSKRVGPAGRVYAFEPDPAALASLYTLRRGRSNLFVYPMALSDGAGRADLHVPLFRGRRLNALASLTAPRAQGSVAHDVVSVPLERLDALLPEGGPPITFIKCDVEGHERAVLRGAEATLRRSMPAVLVEIEQRHQAKGTVDEVFAYLAAIGYEGYALFPDALKPLAAFDLERHQLAYLGEDFVPYGMPHGYVGDFLFVRPGTDISRI